MAIRAARLSVDVDADTRGADRGLDSLNRRIGGFGKNVLGISALVGGFGAAAVAGFVYKAGTAYQDSLNIFQSVSRATETEMNRVRSTAKLLGNDLTLPATSAADAALAMTELAKAGLSVDQTVGAAKGTLQLAAAAQIDEARAATIAANALNSFRLEATEANRIADLLAATANSSSAEITHVADAFGQASAVFASAGFKVEDLSAALGILANRGIKGSDAGTSLKSMLLALQTPTNKAKDLMRDLGISVYDAQGRMKPFRDIISNVTAATKDLTQQERDMALGVIFGSDAIRSANVVLAGGTKQWDEMAKAVGRSGAASEVAAARSKGLRGAIDGLKSTLETGAITAFEYVGPVVEGMVRSVTGALQGLPGIVASAFEYGPIKAFQTGFTDSRIYEDMKLLDRLFARAGQAIGTFLFGFRDAKDMMGAFDEAGRMAQVGFIVRKALDAIADGAGKLRRFLDPLIEKIGGWGTILKVVGGAIAGIVAAGVLGALVSGLGLLLGVVVAVLSPFLAWPAIIGAVAAALYLLYQRSETFRNIIGAVADFVTTYVIPALVTFAEAAVKQFMRVVAWVREWWPTIKDAISNVMAVVVPIVTLAVRAIVAAFQFLAAVAWPVVKAVFNAIWATVKMVMGVIQGVIEFVLGVIAGDWDRAWGGIKKVFSSVWNGLKGVVSAALTGLWELIKTIPGTIFNLLKDLGSILVDAGKAVVEGLWNGISSMGGWLAGKIVGFVKDAVTSPFEKALEIFSPSRVMAGLGKQIPRGLAKGINAERRLVQASMTDLARVATESAQAALTSRVPGVTLASGAEGLTPSFVAPAPAWAAGGRTGGDTYVFQVEGSVVTLDELAEKVRGLNGERGRFNDGVFGPYGGGR